MSGGRPVVLVSVGTDHHPFDRLIDWVDEWLESVAADVECVVQHGTSKAPRLARGTALLGHAELADLMARAAVIVSHGGPTTIMEARRRGLRPVVVPRDASLGEHVDNHQRLFAERMARGGLVELATTRGELHRVLDDALAHPDALLLSADGGSEGSSPVAASARFGELVAELTGTSSPRPRPQVLFIGGSGRSGTTLVERLLGQIEGMTAVGELVHLWERGVRDNELCGCGTPLRSCPFWTEVGKAGYGGWETLDTEWVIGTRWAVDRTRRIPQLALPLLGLPAWRRRMRAWARHLGLLYAGLSAAAGGDTIVDSSKHVSYALLLRHVPVDVRVIAVMRDPRAVAHSWSRVERRPEVVGGDAYMPQYGLLKASALWVIDAVGHRLIGALGVPVTRVRYEDLCSDPVGTLDTVLAAARVASPGPIVGADGTVTMGVNHTAAGNPMRFRTGEIRLRQDTAWQSEMPAWRRRLVTAITWPWLLRFGYPLRVRRP